MTAFREKVAIVTGGASGIGLALGRALAGRGARVVLADLDAEKVARAAGEVGGAARGERLDVTDADAFRAIVDATVAREGRLDLLFNNAGVGLAGEVLDMTLADWRRIVDVNLWGVIHGIAAAYPVMVRQGAGHIVNVASGAGLVPRPGLTAYAATKYAVVGLSLSLRGEAADRGVLVSVVCPGNIGTSIIDSTTYLKLDKERIKAAIPIRPMAADACAAVVLEGVARDRAIIPVTGLTWLEWWIHRLSPGLQMRLSRWRARRMLRLR